MEDATGGRGGGSSAAAPLSVTRAAPHREGRGRGPAWRSRGWGRRAAGEAAALSPVRRGAAAAGPGTFIVSVPGAAPQRRRRDWPPAPGPAAPPPLIGRERRLSRIAPAGAAGTTRHGREQGTGRAPTAAPRSGAPAGAARASHPWGPMSLRGSAGPQPCPARQEGTVPRCP